MLLSLSIRDFVLIDTLTLSFDEGLHVLSGETGAGKSILLDALRLCLGARSDQSLIRIGTEQASVAATFSLISYPHLKTTLLQHHIPCDDDLLICRRVLLKSGRGQAYINDQMVSLSFMKDLGDQLIEIHGQFDRLFNPTTHRQLLDEFAQAFSVRQDIKQAYKNWKTAVEAYGEADERLSILRRDEELLRHQVKELSALAVDENEEEELILQRERLIQSTRISDALHDALSCLSGYSNDSKSIMTLLMTASKSLQKIRDMMGPELQAALSAIDRAEVEVDEALQQVLSAKNQLETNPRRLDDVEERLQALRDMARKHRCAVSDLPSMAQKLEKELSFLDQASENLNKLQVACAMTQKAYKTLADVLHIKRQEAASRLDHLVTAELPSLKLPHARFLTQIDALADSQWGEEGMDRVEFMISINKGQTPSPLAKTASGGELSRLMLALKVVLTSQSALPTIVFDEIDSGVGGATATAIGERLLRVSQHIQVLAITHAPQIAALAQHHYRVSKIEKGERMATSVVQLSSEERREEIARMLSGETITPEAMAAADRLLGSASQKPYETEQKQTSIR